MSSLKAVPKIEHEQRELECVLTDTEYAQRSARMSASELEIEGLKTQRSSLTRQINELAAERNTLAHTLDTRRESRVIDCVWERDYGRGVAVLMRSDNRAIVETRDLTPDERQQSLALVTSPDPEPAPETPKPTRARKAPTPRSTHHEHVPEGA